MKININWRRWLDRLFSTAHEHQWETTHVNRYMHTMAEECVTCHLSRKKVFKDDSIYWHWKYSDGTEENCWREYCSGRIVPDEEARDPVKEWSRK